MFVDGGSCSVNPEDNENILFKSEILNIVL